MPACPPYSRQGREVDTVPANRLGAQHLTPTNSKRASFEPSCPVHSGLGRYHLAERWYSEQSDGQSDPALYRQTLETVSGPRVAARKLLQNSQQRRNQPPTQRLAQGFARCIHLWRPLRAGGGQRAAQNVFCPSQIVAFETPSRHSSGHPSQKCSFGRR